jgi:predicted nucleotidyltransferase
MQSTYDRVRYYKINKPQKEALTKKIGAVLAKEKNIKAAWIFGSLTRGDSVRDIDIAVYSEPKLTFMEYLDLNAKIELEVGIPVDMVDISAASQSLKENIFAIGILIKGNKRFHLQQ